MWPRQVCSIKAYRGIESFRTRQFHGKEFDTHDSLEDGEP